MAGAVINKAEIEYAAMLTVLDFQTEFMKSAYSHVRVSVYDELIYVTSVRSASIPAEKELGRSPEGHELLRRFHRTLFDSCQHVLQKRMEQATA
ncbi:Na-translocating system protein MpsC family protein [Nitrospira sp. BLG_2]|uniref:Na-translocating system protein MpsC family protein n=1 Tax=Nitrospira sp. BLG_2 TaxID=3397507 RepID=UPI003B9B2766